MNRRASAGDNVAVWYTAYLIFGAVFFAGMLYWIFAFQSGAAKWEDFYAKEIVRLIDNGKVGDEISLDVSDGSAIGFKQNMASAEMFTFDNFKKEVLVKLGANSGAKFSYFRNVSIVDYRLETPEAGAVTNRLHFKIVEGR